MSTDPAGAVLVGAFDGTAMTAAEIDFMSAGHMAGVTLFGRNIATPYQDTSALTRALQALRPAGEPPFVVAIDQEGGRVARIKNGFPERGPALKLADGRHDPAALAEIRDYGGEIARALLALGINVDFAPVLDVLTEPSNIAIGDRAFGTEVEPAWRRAEAFLDGMQRAGVLGSLKHFPGQGDAKVDTHAGQAVVDLPLATLEAREFVPFKKLVKKCPMVMVSHCVYPALDTVEASRSSKVMGDLLRRQMGFSGVVVSDDMIMGAMPQDDTPWRQAIVDCVAAGADMVLVCKHLDRMKAAHEALTEAAAKSPAFAARLTDAGRRVTALRHTLRSS
jgi:beta-N-acetylhexosaminidase